MPGDELPDLAELVIGEAGAAPDLTDDDVENVVREVGPGKLALVRPGGRACVLARREVNRVRRCGSNRRKVLMKDAAVACPESLVTFAFGGLDLLAPALAGTLVVKVFLVRMVTVVLLDAPSLRLLVVRGSEGLPESLAKTRGLAAARKRGRGAERLGACACVTRGQARSSQGPGHDGVGKGVKW